MTTDLTIPQTTTTNVLVEVLDERRRQDAKWGQQDHPWSATPSPPIYSWAGRPDINTADRAKFLVETYARGGQLGYADILMEEVYEALDETDVARAREELIQVAAVAVAAIESIDRNGR